MIRIWVFVCLFRSWTNVKRRRIWSMQCCWGITSPCRSWSSGIWQQSRRPGQSWYAPSTRQSSLTSWSTIRGGRGSWGASMSWRSGSSPKVWRYTERWGLFLFPLTNNLLSTLNWNYSHLIQLLFFPFSLRSFRLRSSFRRPAKRRLGSTRPSGTICSRRHPSPTTRLS